MAPRYPTLNPERALIWRIIHRDNLDWVLAHGLQCANSGMRDPNFIPIGNPDLIAGRKEKHVQLAPGGTLSDYIPFYFTPFSPMMMNILSGRGVPARSREETCILVSSLPKVVEKGLSFIFTDRHAYADLANFYSDLNELSNIDWERIQAKDFKRDPEDPEKFEKYQAEALVHQELPVDALLGVVCYSEAVKSRVAELAESHSINLDVQVRPRWYL